MAAAAGKAPALKEACTKTPLVFPRPKKLGRGGAPWRT